MVVLHVEMIAVVVGGLVIFDIVRGIDVDFAVEYVC